MNDIVLVTGAGGFIGGHLVARLRALGTAKLRAVDIKPLGEWQQRFEDAENIVADLRDKTSCYLVCEGVRDMYNLAADMGGIGFIEHHKAGCMLSVLINTHLLLAARDLKVRRYFYSSTACVYNTAKQDAPGSSALKESDAYPANPEDGYGWEKLFSERLCRHFQEDHGMYVRVARLHNAYGPFGTWKGGREKAPAALCRKVIEAKARNGVVDVWGTGAQTRSFMYVDDTVEGIMRIMNSGIDEPINLGSSEQVSINGLLDTIEKIAGVKITRAYQPDKPQGVQGRNSDNKMILERLGWEPKTSLHKGLQTTYQWIEGEFLKGQKS